MKHLLLLLALSFLLTGCSLSNPTPSTPTSSSDSNPSLSQTISGSLQDLLTRDQSLQCTWNYQNQQSQGQGEIFVSGQKFRGSTTINVPNQGQVTTQMLSDGQWMYQWGGPLAQGVKMNLQELESAPPEQSNDQQAQSAYQTINQNYQYDCQPWTPDQSKFQVPADVTFVDLNQMINNATQNVQDMQQDPCAMCNLLPADSQADCLKNCQ
jgi:hypothetical protein